MLGHNTADSVTNKTLYRKKKKTPFTIFAQRCVFSYVSMVCAVVFVR